jgi:hypothetical protein
MALLTWGCVLLLQADIANEQISAAGFQPQKPVLKIAAFGAECLSDERRHPGDGFLAAASSGYRCVWRRAGRYTAY